MDLLGYLQQFSNLAPGPSTAAATGGEGEGAGRGEEAGSGPPDYRKLLADAPVFWEEARMAEAAVCGGRGLACVWCVFVCVCGGGWRA